MALAPKNWKSFQHYKDRAPLWIKLHRGLLDNRDYHLLTPLAGKCLPLVWLIASEKDGLLPETDEVAFRLRVSVIDAEDILKQLTDRGFLIEVEDTTDHAEHDATLSQKIAASNGFGSRHIPDSTKRLAWDRDGGKCKKCGSTENIEYDHVHPVSKGGNSELENIQLLCRPCNRSKRVSIATPAQPIRNDSRSLEKEDIDKRKSREEPSSKRTSGNDDFENLRKVYPKRKGNYGWKAAERKFNSLVKTGVDPKIIIAAAVRLGETLSAKIGTEFIPMPATWLNSEDFLEVAVAAFPLAEKLPIEDAIRLYVQNGHWSRHAPVSDVSQAPPELLEKHGLLPDGRRMQ